MRGNDISMHPKISLFHKDGILDISPYVDSSFAHLVLLMILNLFFIMTGITPEMTGNQLPCYSSNKIGWKCKQEY
jgi:hypothetical protein